MTNTNTPATDQQQAFDATTYQAVLETVRRRLTILEEADNQLQKQKEMLDDVFVNDAAYQKADEAVKEVSKKRTDERARITKTPQAQMVLEKIKEIKTDIDENKDILSQELMQYYKVAGVTEIEDSQGNIQEFKITVKLTKKHKA